jgi:predicted nucleic acid-binding protein
LALLSATDAHHDEAARVSKELRARVITTDFVLLELANALANAKTRQVFLGLVSRLQSDPDVLIVPASSDLFEAGRGLYGRRSDKNWSLTDCISFIVMEEHRLRDALTADHHFEQAGFNAILKQRA